MEKEFVPYELAVKLKELGFDNLCVFLYYNNGNNYVIAEPLIKNSDLSGYEEITAPTFSQAFRFFREKYDISSYVDYYENDDYERIWYFIIKTKKYESQFDGSDKTEYCDEPYYKTYEEAEIACLTKLIEIVENNLVD
jgi:hypothetical protein